MFEGEGSEAGFVNTLGGVIPERGEVAESEPAGWRGRVNEFGREELSAFWAEAVRHAHREIGRYVR